MKIKVLSIKNFENLFESSNLKIKEINDKYFQNENDQVIYFYPSNKISIYNEINERNGEYSDLSTKENDIDLVKINDEIILIFNKNYNVLEHVRDLRGIKDVF